MTLATLEKSTKSVPFTLCFLEEVPQDMYDQAVAESVMLKDSYDSQTQTSNVPLYAGTSLTYRDTGSTPIVKPQEDTAQSDT